jgi:MFS family permease
MVVLGMLLLVYTFNFLDRQIVAILAAPIQGELDLTDTQLGLVGGLAFSLFFAAVAIPIAMLADRRSRTGIVTVALVAWSAMTAMSGLAQNFWQLFLARLGVGIGEAGGVAPSLSLLADYFPTRQRARAFAVYSFGVPIGSALGILLGGILATVVDWRMAFIVVGLAGVAVAPVFRALVREPQRGRYDAPAASQRTPGLYVVVRVLLRKPAFWGLAFGAASSSVIGYGPLFWMPSFLMRSHGLDLIEASLYFAAILLVGGIAGIWCGGLLADRLGAARRRAYALVPGVAFFCTVPFLAGAVSTTSLAFSFVLFLIPTALGLAWLGPVLSAIQHLAPPEMRSTVSAIYLFVNNLIGFGLGAVVLGALSDLFSGRHGDESLRHAILLGSLCYVVAGSLLLLSAKRLERDWE